MEKINNKILKYKIDDDFFRLYKQPSEKELSELNNHISHYGFSDKIYIWNDFILTNYSEYYICLNLNLPFDTVQLSFKTKNEVINWICIHELQKDGLTIELRRYLIGKRFLSLLSLLNDDIINGSDHKSLLDKKIIGKCKIATELATELKLTSTCIQNYGKYSEWIDTIAIKDSSISRQILSGKPKLSINIVKYISTLSKKQIMSINELFYSEVHKKITYSDIRSELSWSKYTRQPKKEVILPIKQLPKYDPDAEITSLSLTIPSWISTINRIHARTDFNQTTLNAKKQLIKQLESLKLSIDNISKEVI